MTPVTAPMVGKILEIPVKSGDRVNEDDTVIVMEAMKMEIPVVAPVSGTIGEERAVEALKSGATDYVLKGNLLRLPPAIERAVADARDRAERDQARRKHEETLTRLDDDLYDGGRHRRSEVPGTLAPFPPRVVSCAR